MSYRAFKRLLGETSLERKCHFLFGGFILVLITGSFWLYARETESLAYEQISTACRLIAVQIVDRQIATGCRPPSAPGVDAAERERTAQALVEFRSDWEKRWPEALQKEFEAYVQNGGGFVSVHAADNSFGKWEAYNKMIGVGGWGGRNEKSGPWIYVKDGKMFRDTSAGNAGAHGAQHEFLVEIVNPNHPITKGLPAKWMHAKDELYSSLRGPAENLEVLSYSTSDKTNQNEPNMMVLSHGKGRVFHTTLGHADYSMLERGFYTILQRGTEWAATGDVKACAAVPADFNTAEKVSVIALPTK